MPESPQQTTVTSEHFNRRPPTHFNRESYEAFKALQLEASDVIMASYPKCGTSWLHQIIFCLLRMDDQGNISQADLDGPGADNQLYPSAVPLNAPSPRPPRGDKKAGPFGRFGFDDLLAQPSPRLISCKHCLYSRN